MTSEKAQALEARFNAWLARRQLFSSPVASQHVSLLTAAAIGWEQSTPQVAASTRYQVSGTLFCQPTSAAGSLRLTFNTSGCTMNNIRVGFVEFVTTDGVGGPGSWTPGFGATVKAEADAMVGSTWGAGMALRQTLFGGEIYVNAAGSLILGVAMGAAGNTWDVLYGSYMEVIQVMP